MSKVDKIKKIAIIVLIVSFLCFFILIFGRKYDPLFNIFKVVSLMLFLVITFTWVVIQLLVDIKNQENQKLILMSCLDVVIWMMLIPFLSIVTTPQSNIFDIGGTPYEKKISYYDKYSNLIYSTEVDDYVLDVVEISLSDTLLELQFFGTYEGKRAGTGLFEDEVQRGYEIIENLSVRTLADLKITYDLNHQILTYDLRQTRQARVSYKAKEKYVYISMRLVVENNYSFSSFTSMRSLYEFYDVSDSNYSLDSINHYNDFDPEEVLYSYLSSTKTIISTDRVEYEIIYESYHYLNSLVYHYDTQFSQMNEEDSRTIKPLENDAYSRSFTFDENQILLSITDEENRYDPESYIRERYKRYNGIFVLVQYGIDSKNRDYPYEKLNVYRSLLNKEIYIEKVFDSSVLAKIKHTNYGYQVIYYDSINTSKLELYFQYSSYPYLYLDFNMSYLDYYWILSYDLGYKYRVIDFPEVIYPNMPIFTFV